jgi:tetratricopeptide (TPR) repeat protein
VIAPEAPEVASLCKEALAHARKYEFEAARVLYARALGISPSTAILFNLALAELHSARALDALRHFREYLRANDADPSKLPIVRTDLLPKAFGATGHIQIMSSPAGAKLYLDGQEIVSAPGGVVDVTPGPHVVTARSPDQGWRADVTADPGVSTEAKFALVWVHSGALLARSDAGP